MTEKRPVCLAPWIHLHVDTIGEIRPCCICTLSIKADSIEEGWNSPEMKSLRIRMLNGELPPEYCGRCINSNRTTVHSMTFDWEAEKIKLTGEELIEKTAEDGNFNLEPISIDLRTHLCNLKCRTCSGFASSAMRSEVIKFNLPIKQYHTTKLSDIALGDLPFIDNVRKIYWAGGEPFMSPLHWEVMDHLVETNNTDMLVFYSTNVTFPGKTLERAIKILKNFRELEFNISIDGEGDYGDYVRSGIDTNEAWENIRRLREELPHAKIKIDTTITNCGILTLDKILQRCVDLKIGWMGHLMFKSPHNNYLDERLLKPGIFKSCIEAARAIDSRPETVKSLNFIEASYEAAEVNHKIFFECDRYEEVRGMKGFFKDKILPFLNMNEINS